MRKTILASSLKFIAIIVLSTLFISTMSIRQSQAGSKVKCPCDYVSALSAAQILAAKIGGLFPFRISECFIETDDGGDNLHADGETSNSVTCFVELSAERNAEETEIECDYEFTCGEDEVPPSFFTLKTEEDNLTDQEYEACIRKIEFISEKIFRVECPEDDE
jgi:hypothetical protein